ncbi:MAG: TonB-dependent receptor [Sphingomonas sp.]
MKISRLLGATALAGSLLMTPTIAWAQDDTTTTPDNQDDEDQASDAPIVVTGSRIARPTLSSSVPVTSVDVSELTNQGSVSLGDALNDLPSLRSTYSLGNSTRFIGTAGLSLLDLRGLGISRTLVLVNGRRHITASPGDYLVDANTIPVDLLERVDVVTGGDSAIYGSDAVAGVVNFILKRDFDGISLRGQGGVSERSDRGAYFASATFGSNFAEGRGNVALSVEYANSQPLYFKDRDSLTGAYSGRCQFNVAEPQGAAGGETGPSASDGVSDTQFFCGVRNNGISDGGTLGTITIGGVAGAGAYRFNGAGNLYLDTGFSNNFTPFGSGNVQGGNGSTLRNTGQLAAGLSRYSVNFLAHFDVSDAFKPFVEAKYVRIEAIQEGQPSFIQSGTLATLRCSNPFLGASNLSIMQGLGLCANPATGSFTLGRFNVDFGGRGEQHVRQTYRVVAGIEGDFNDDWHYEIAANWGRLETAYDAVNNLYLFDAAGNPDGYLLAKDAVAAPAAFTGSNFVTSASGVKTICAVNAGANGNIRPDCVPLNMFGENRADPRALAFSNVTGHRDEWAEELVISAFVRGDLSQLFELPGGPVQFAFGGEYRTEKAYSKFDSLTQNGQTFLNAIQPFTPPALEVKDAYAEVRIPLLKDMPGFELLSIEGAARVSDYNTSTGTVWAYNVSGIWAPIQDIRFRANYSTSVRAPTQSDLFSTASQNFAQLTDPCDALQITNGTNRVTNCLAAGLPSGVVGGQTVPVNNAANAAACAGTAFAAAGAVGLPFVNCLARSSSTAYTSGGNPTLVAEEGKSLTIGTIITPRWIPGLSITVDYYRIDLENRISALPAQTILNLCFDNAGGINNPYCALTNPRLASGGFSTTTALLSSGINFAKQKTEGVDVDVAYNHRFANGHRLNIRAIGTRVITLDNYVNPLNVNIPDRQLSELGDPMFSANGSVNYDFGTFSIGYSVQYIGPQTISTYETQNSFLGACPANGVNPGGGSCTAGAIVTLPPANADANPFIYYPDVFYHNLRVGIDVDDFTLYLGVDNIMDTMPPYGLLGTAGGDPFDVVGRYFYAGFNVDF